MNQTDFFGTFLDTLKSSTVERGLSAFGRSMPSSTHRSAATPRDGLGEHTRPSGVAAAGADPADPTDKVFQKLAALDKAGSLPADLTELIPAGSSSLSLLLHVISRLEEFGVVERTIEGRINLTGVGHKLAEAVP